MKNITVSVPEEVYRSARVRAAERGTSVSALVSEYLASLSRNEREFARLLDQQRRIVSGINRFRASERLEREDLHNRAIR
ncbi:MAG: DUF6364 family protein [Acidimicrobiia bacterium]